MLIVRCVHSEHGLTEAESLTEPANDKKEGGTRANTLSTPCLSTGVSPFAHERYICAVKGGTAIEIGERVLSRWPILPYTIMHPISPRRSGPPHGQVLRFSGREPGRPTWP